MYSFKEQQKIFDLLFNFVKVSAGLHLRHAAMDGLPQVMEEVNQQGYERLMDKFRDAGIGVEARFDKYEMVRNDAAIGVITFLSVDEETLKLKVPAKLPPVPRRSAEDIQP